MGLWKNGTYYRDGGNVSISGDISASGDLSVAGDITSPSGQNVKIVPDTSGITVIGDAGSTSHGLSSNDDLLVTGEVEIDGALNVDGQLKSFGGSLFLGNINTFNDNKSLYFGSLNDVQLVYSTGQSAETMLLGLGSVANYTIICQKADLGTNFGHAAETDPTLFIQSADATDVSQFISIQHNQTDRVDGVGSGGLVRVHEAPVELADDASFDLPDASAGFGTFLAGDGEEYAVISWTTAGVVTLRDNSTNVTATDTDTNLCFFDNGTAVRVRNRLGSAKKITFNYNYTTAV